MILDSVLSFGVGLVTGLFDPQFGILGVVGFEAIQAITSGAVDFLGLLLGFVGVYLTAV